ncbi:phosphoribosylanthranilate isomerase [Mesoterricola silvestris]|uniref:N-(5'-phosphoribosyl)anthranilate isomerase n=1 Tax=Mesoterricola silvestris TaxID=2927979 RepID=A0AA48GPR6_9BACT|nr:phosphoribosylanthranilate isomerase [Mesoterricola silvestris]BDU73859.1 N-(5'-phosphoribosyl)anthranilate isomerase [Mesoterricola silvestris]
MRLAPLPFVKICCISSLDEARLAVACGASALGLVSAMPSGPGVIGDDLVARIAAAVPPPIATFLLTARQDADGILRQHRRCRTTTIQLVDRVPPADLRKLRQELPGIRIVQVVHVTGEAALAEARALEGLVDALLLDSGNPALAVKELGGTGRTHDWGLSRAIVEATTLPVFLAGGLNPRNIAQAVALVRPFGVDLCSGVRRGGRLDATKLEMFFAALRAGA